jgi:DNA-binding transcriptional regulator YhcF (GntR family)
MMDAPMAGSSADDQKHKERQAYKKRFEQVLQDFLNGTLKDGETVIDSREKATVMAESEARKAVQEMKKNGIKVSVYADY